MSGYKFVILGKPVSQKNDRMIAKRPDGRRIPIPKKGIREYRASALAQLKQQWDKPPIEGRILCSLIAHQGERQSIDIDNCLGAPFDALKDAGIIKNDYQIEGVSAFRCRDKENPRIEITLWEVAKYWTMKVTTMTA